MAGLHSALVDEGIPCALFPWPLDQYCTKYKLVIFLPNNATGDILLKHTLLQRLVPVSASPSD